MNLENLLERYLVALLKGERKEARRVIEQALQSGRPANSVYIDIIWPIMAEIEALLRAGKINPAQEHMATRINRTIVDQLQNKLPRKPVKEKKVAVACAQEDIQELGAQMIADLFESDGWDIKFLGGGLTNDDILAFVNEYGPDLLVLYGCKPKQAPAIRRLIDTLKNVNAWPNMRIMLSGGVFNRAEGLCDEIGADLFASTAAQALEVARKKWQLEAEQSPLNARERRSETAQKTTV